MKKTRFLTLLSLLVGFFLLGSSFVVANDQEKDFLVVYNDVSIKTASIENSNSVKSVLEEDYCNFNVLKVKANSEELADIKADPLVKYVVPDIDLETYADEVTWSDNMVKAPESWNNGYTGQGVKVAVLDTGIAAHSDLVVAGRYDAVTVGGNANDIYGHGTAVAGIIGARTNGIGIVGVAPDISLYAVRVMESSSSGKLSDMIEGLDWCVTNGMDVANLSLGISPDSLSPTDFTYVTNLLNEVTTEAFNAGVIIVAASGNDGNIGITDNVSFPARNNNVLGVGAIDSNKVLAGFSSVGPAVDLVAPGVSVKTTGLNNTYVLGNGTSFATPNVSGVVALYKEKYPDMTNSQLIDRIIDNADDLGPVGFDNSYGNGLSLAEIVYVASPIVDVVKDNVLAITGTGPVGGSVEVTLASGVKLNGPVDGSGRFTVGLSGYLRAGTAISVVGIDANGNRSKAVVADVQTSTGVYYNVHIQDIGWQGLSKNGATAGTIGQAKRLEALAMIVSGYDGVGIKYSTHIQDIGWQDWRYDGAISGTEGQAKRLEAIKIELTGVNAGLYDVYYRVHAENYGWLDWAKNGGSAGTEGMSYRLEAIEVKLVPKDSGGFVTAKPFYSIYGNGLVNYRVHIQDIGWQSYRSDGLVAGTSGQSKRLEAINLNLGKNYADGSPIIGGISYNVHIQNIGWQGIRSNGALAGTSGLSLRLEAININLTGEVAAKYDIYYRVHAENFGWMGWAKNGENAGTAGYAYRLEAIEVKLVPKGGAAPGSTVNAYRQK